MRSVSRTSEKEKASLAVVLKLGEAEHTRRAVELVYGEETIGGSILIT